MRGRLPKPTALKVLAGNPGRRPLNAGEPQPTADGVRCPSWLSLDAKREWRRVAPELQRIRLLTVADVSPLASYCDAYATARAMRTIIEREGYTFESKRVRVVDGENGATIEETVTAILPRPEVAILQKSLLIVKAFCVEFGLTPSSRGRLHIEPPKQKDEFEEFLSGRRDA